MYFDGAPALWLIPLLPALGALFIFLFSKKISASTAGAVACLSVGLSFLWTLYASVELLIFKNAELFHQSYWKWIDVTPLLSANAAMLFDRISMVFCFVITGVGLLIHIYSTGYMKGEEGEHRFFGYLNLFVASMLVLVLADNAFFMFVGWEGVGAMSFALIGHFYHRPNYVNCARKAFLVTRFGDVFLLLGVLTIGIVVGTVQFINLNQVSKLDFGAMNNWVPLTNAQLLTVACFLLLAGAAGKSAQLPLQNWLPDAMAGPTPVSALIHAATMVTAGVYLIVRFSPVYVVSPDAMAAVAVIGAATAFYGATCALVQSDIKRILAYSTISQIGYMILALGVGAFSFGLFHFFTHAFYKALLFLSAGTVIHALHGEQNVYNMGGLKSKIPSVYWIMLIGSAALAGIPLTSGFFSKDAILWAAFSSPYGNKALYGAGLLTALLTAIYSFRLMFLVFHGSPRKDIHVHEPHGTLVWPLAALAIPALLIGFLNVPIVWTAWEHFFAGSLPPLHAGEEHHHAVSAELMAIGASALIALAGACIAWALFNPAKPKAMQTPKTAIAPGDIQTDTPSPFQSIFANFLFHGWWIDRLYTAALVRPYVLLTKVIGWIDAVIIDGIFEVGNVTIQLFHGFFVTMQNSRLSRYATVMFVGAVTLTAIIIFVYPGMKLP